MDELAQHLARREALDGLTGEAIDELERLYASGRPERSCCASASGSSRG